MIKWDYSYFGKFRDMMKNIASTPPNPLFTVAYFGYTTICRSLWESKNYNFNCTNDRNQTPLYIASSRDHTGVVNFLLSHNADVNHISHQGDNNPMIAAIEANNVDVLELLLRALTVARSKLNENILFLGCLRGTREVVESLLTHDTYLTITEAMVMAAASNF
jgi:serine/threonine-protein phosphatase 6 regulatory ankyrin repeat subunit B